jgi:alpha,alpha-trehalase
MRRVTGHAEHRRAAATRSPPSDDCTPADRYEELFTDVQGAQVFPDSKTFVDCSPRGEPQKILAAYREQRGQAGFDLAAFVHTHFELPRPAHSDYVPTPGQTLAEHIDSLWPYLVRQPEQHPPCGSLLPLPHEYVVPGGRFVEMYYWDSYFTMLGLAESGQRDCLHAMTDNFAWLIDRYGHVPNGNRTYYLSRSQPPVFALMTRLCEERGGQPAIGYLPQLRREHAFWMDGEGRLPPGQAHRRLVHLPDGTLLNRYWDERCTPREESWREDVATAARSERPREEVYRHLRAAAESGWDFSTRWMAEGSEDLASILTTDVLPVDLNAFLHELECTIARLSRASGDAQGADAFEARAKRRARAIRTLLWDAQGGFFVDHDWRLQRRRSGLSAAALAPLYCGVALPSQAEAMAAVVRERLLAPGGMGCTEHASGEQWDRPNGWAPLQWMAAEGLQRYGQDALAAEIRRRWLATVQSLYAREGKLVEKYALREDLAHPAKGGGGGEYPLQDGFGWTNGVTRRWLHAQG